MSKIQVKYDPTLKQSEIITRLDNSSPEEEGEYYDGNQTDLQQTAIYGIHCPIIAVNNIMIAYEDIVDFILTDYEHVPKVDMCIIDRKGIIQYLDTPGNDNELRVQILPPFDDVYKKINLTFFISKYTMGSGGKLYIKGEYKLPKFISSRFRSFGEVSLYKLFDQVSSDCQLGFSTNVEDTDDKRYVYCSFNSYKNIIDKEISYSGGETVIYDWWIDVWNYMNLADMYERYKAIDPDDDLKIWISGQISDVTQSVKIEPQQVKAELTNLYGSQETQLYVKAYRVANNAGLNMSKGTDKVYSVYSMNGCEYKDTYISDGDVKKDTSDNFEYKGEVYGDFDYISQGMYREPFLQKIKTGALQVDLDSPLLGIQRGNRINFACYYDNDNIVYPIISLEENGLLNDVKTNVPIEEISPDANPLDQDTFKLNKAVSGQYLIIGNIYKYSNRRWTQTCILTRPADQNPKMLKDDK